MCSGHAACACVLMVLLCVGARRLKVMSLATGAELDRHNELLDDISTDLDRVNSSLHKATARSAKLSKG